MILTAIQSTVKQAVRDALENGRSRKVKGFDSPHKDHRIAFYGAKKAAIDDAIRILELHGNPARRTPWTIAGAMAETVETWGRRGNPNYGRSWNEDPISPEESYLEELALEGQAEGEAVVLAIYREILSQV